MQGTWIFPALIIAGLVIAVVILIYLNSSKNNEITEISRVAHQNAQNLKEFRNKYEGLLNDKNKLIKQLDAALEGGEGVLKEKCATLEKNILNAQLQLKNINEMIESRTVELNDASNQLKIINDESIRLQRYQAEFAAASQGYKNELEALNKELQDAKRTAQALREEGNKDIFNNGLKFELSVNEKKLIGILKEIMLIYPELSKDLATIEWKKIWMPKVQKWNENGKLNVRGIYRLVLKDDETVGYVGQAVNIKERWYEHIKKMIGADSKGGELVYEFRPDDFYWSVLEEGTIDLNKAERYWIEYYGKGLNKN